jgi:hypothetical protein
LVDIGRNSVSAVSEIGIAEYWPGVHAVKSVAKTIATANTEPNWYKTPLFCRLLLLFSGLELLIGLAVGVSICIAYYLIFLKIARFEPFWELREYTLQIG